jgi:hypothetical protein
MSIGNRLLPAVLLLSAISVPAYSQGTQDIVASAKSSFRLNARFDDRASLSRDELMTPDSQIPAPFRSNRSQEIDGQGGEALPMPDVQMPAQPTGMGFPLGAQQNQEPQGQSSMTEYGVDWSKWVGQMADRWFYALKKLEDQSDYQFHTVRPALIQFTAYPDGHIDNISLKQTSGVDLYDRLQIQSLMMCQPAPHFPRGTKRTNFTLVQGWESHPKQQGEEDYQPGTFGHGFPMEKVKQWVNSR